MMYGTQTITDQYEQILEMFACYLNDTVSTINTIKKSIYQILNIPLISAEIFVQPELPSVSANCKKTIDDLKRISSILRGYSKSKNLQRQDQQIRKSRVQSSLSRDSRSKNSGVSEHSRNSPILLPTFKKNQPTRQKGSISLQQAQQISMVTFQIPKAQLDQNQHQQLSNQQLTFKLNNYRSLRSLSKTTQLLVNQNYDTSENGISTQNYFSPYKGKFKSETNQPSRRRARTLQNNFDEKPVSLMITQTEQKFKECLQKHENGMDEIIKRNTQCLQILKDIHKNFKNKKQKKKIKEATQKFKIQSIKYQSPNSNEVRILKYQAMTPSSRKKQVTVN